MLILTPTDDRRGFAGDTRPFALDASSPQRPRRLADPPRRLASLTGKATFGFVAQYKKGATVPTGNTQFRFHAGDLHFHSTSYDWPFDYPPGLVRAGSRLVSQRLSC